MSSLPIINYKTINKQLIKLGICVVRKSLINYFIKINIFNQH